MKFLITKYDYAPRAMFLDEVNGVCVRWTREGLCFLRLPPGSEAPCPAGTTMTWEELLAKKTPKLTLMVPGWKKPLIITYEEALNEADWMSFLRCFPEEERPKIFDAYWGERYALALLDGRLSRAFFTRLLSCCPNEFRDRRESWMERYYRFLSSQLSSDRQGLVEIKNIR